jgi:hypothetical protein
MKLICIDDYDLNGRKVELTYGKIYNVDLQDNQLNPSEDGEAWVVTNDAGMQRWYYNDVLMPLEKWREIQLKELGI